MKNWVIILCCLPQLLYTQVEFSYVSPIKGAQYKALAVHQSGSMVTVGSSNSLCPNRLVNYFDKSGQLQWQNSSQDYRLDAATDVLFNQAGNIVIVGANRPSYDIILDNNDSIYVLELDTSGNILLQQNFYLQTSFSSPSFAPIIIELTDSTYLVGAAKQLFWIKKDGNLIKSQSIEVDQIIGLNKKANQYFTVLGPNKAILFQMEGHVLGAVENSGQKFIDLSIVGDTTFIISKDQLLAIYDLENIRSYNLPDSLSHAQLSGNNDNQSLEILFQFGPSEASIIRFNQQVWDTFQLKPFLGEYITDFRGMGNQYYFIGTDQWGTDVNPLEGTYLRSTSLEDKLTQPDLSLESVVISAIEELDTLDQITHWANTDSIIAFVIGGHFAVKFEVRNTGTETIENFVIFSQSVAAFNCVENRSFEYIQNVQIAPGETYRFSTSFIISASFSAIEELNGIGFCFSIAAPNYQFDQQKSNNHFCTTLLPTTTKEKFIISSQLKAFPNPAQSFLRIELLVGNPIQKVELYNLQGKLQTTKIITQSHSAQIFRGDLPAGIYLLKVYTEKGIGAQKVIFR